MQPAGQGSGRPSPCCTGPQEDELGEIHCGESLEIHENHEECFGILELIMMFNTIHGMHAI